MHRLEWMIVAILALELLLSIQELQAHLAEKWASGHATEEDQPVAAT